jgi:hypothetical protein
MMSKYHISFSRIAPSFRSVSMGILLSIALTSCGGQVINMKDAADAAVPLNSQTLPSDVKLVSASILMQMKGFGENQIKGVSYIPGAAQNLKSIGMDFDGFVLKGINIVNYEPMESHTELVGVMVFEDNAGRRAGVRYLADYQIEGQGILMQKASVVPVYTTRPRVEAYLVPYDPVVDMDALSSDHSALYQYAVMHAISIAQAPAETGDYDVFMFAMDRSSETSLGKGRISKDVSKLTGFEGATTVLDFNGWKVAIISGELSPQGNTTLYSKMLHTPGDEGAWFLRSSRLRGLFGLTVKSQYKYLAN